MPGTGKHGYTGPALYGGSYNIQNGIIQSGSAATPVKTSNGHIVVNRNSPYGVNNSASHMVAQQISSVPQASSLAASVAGTAGLDSSDYGEYIREILAASEKNTALSQAFAREQMDYQTKSDQAAMAWSAQEAQKNRDWQERLANTAHQREVTDLMAAGLNPILSANQGAYTGSGATGQGFSSSGAMGNVDTSGAPALAGLYSTVMNTASQAMIAGIYADASRYQADSSVAASRIGAEASILNNRNTTSAQKEIAANQMLGELERTNISAAAQRYSADKNLAAAGTTAAASRYAADQHLAATKESAAASRYSADKSYDASVYGSENNYASTRYATDIQASTAEKNRNSNLWNNPVGYGISSGISLFNLGKEVLKDTYKGSSHEF